MQYKWGLFVLILSSTIAFAQNDWEESRFKGNGNGYVSFDHHKGFYKVQGRLVEMKNGKIRSYNPSDMSFIDITLEKGKLDKIKVIPSSAKGENIIVHNGKTGVVMCFEQKDIAYLVFSEVSFVKGTVGDYQLIKSKSTEDEFLYSFDRDYEIRDVDKWLTREVKPLRGVGYRSSLIRWVTPDKKSFYYRDLNHWEEEPGLYISPEGGKGVQKFMLKDKRLDLNLELEGGLPSKFIKNTVFRNPNGGYYLMGAYGEKQLFDALWFKKIQGVFFISLDEKGNEIKRRIIKSSEFGGDVADVKTLECLMLNEQIQSVVVTVAQKKKNPDRIVQNIITIGINEEQVWKKELPINHTNNYGATQFNPHALVHTGYFAENLVLIYNDNSKNQQKFNYSDYQFSEGVEPYTGRKADAISIVKISKDGNVDASKIDVKDEEMNLVAVHKKDDGTCILHCSDGNMGETKLYYKFYKLK